MACPWSHNLRDSQPQTLPPRTAAVNPYAEMRGAETIAMPGLKKKAKPDERLARLPTCRHNAQQGSVGRLELQETVASVAALGNVPFVISTDFQIAACTSSSSHIPSKLNSSEGHEWSDAGWNMPKLQPCGVPRSRDPHMGSAERVGVQQLRKALVPVMPPPQPVVTKSQPTISSEVPRGKN